MSNRLNTYGYIGKEILETKSLDQVKTTFEDIDNTESSHKISLCPNIFYFFSNLNDVM